MFLYLLFYRLAFLKILRAYSQDSSLSSRFKPALKVSVPLVHPGVLAREEMTPLRNFYLASKYSDSDQAQISSQDWLADPLNTKKRYADGRTSTPRWQFTNGTSEGNSTDLQQSLIS